MVTEEQAIVPESAFADYEEDLIRDGLPPDQARATRRALERIVDRFTLVFATKTDLHERAWGRSGASYGQRSLSYGRRLPSYGQRSRSCVIV